MFSFIYNTLLVMILPIFIQITSSINQSLPQTIRRITLLLAVQIFKQLIAMWIFPNSHWISQVNWIQWLHWLILPITPVRACLPNIGVGMKMGIHQCTWKCRRWKKRRIDIKVSMSRWWVCLNRILKKPNFNCKLWMVKYSFAVFFIFRNSVIFRRWSRTLQV